MGYKHYGVKTEGVPLELISAIIKGFNTPYFIETGTAGGESIQKAAKIFKNCYTIEIIEKRTPEIISENIQFFTGDSTKIIPNILKKINVLWDYYAVFWLDAHYSDEVECKEEVECPILEEISCIKYTKSIIIIDDARLFFGSPPFPLNPQKWASLQDIFNSFNSNYYLKNNYITIVDDYIVSIPIEMVSNLNLYWRKNFDNRYPNEEKRLKQSVKDSIAALINYI